MNPLMVWESLYDFLTNLIGDMVTIHHSGYNMIQLSSFHDVASKMLA